MADDVSLDVLSWAGMELRTDRSKDLIADSAVIW